ncbi:hypothetical protein P167DRAFT_576678 [Morchella conica CCBAS932]|uniref:Uncharacterized protein n=1 Tax=Morchella conica CCBAS932 TaxID=1392247 RepID=A0A3N4KHL5_9PEZI|nr:hypothetical protein P167DRAFT_576678 [Morchella conica CCBAS932]
MAPRAPKNDVLGTLSLEEQIAAYHHYPIKRIRGFVNGNIKAQYQKNDPQQPIPRKIAFADAAPKLQSGMQELEDDVDRLRGTLKLAQRATPLGKHTLMKTKIRQAREKALGYSDENFMCGRGITKWRHDFPDGNLPSDDEEEDDEDEDDAEQVDVRMTTGTIAGNITGNKDPQIAIANLCAKRDEAAQWVHSQWRFYPASKEVMRKGANIAHMLHRDYLALAYNLKDHEFSCIPRKQIDKSAPREFQEKAQNVQTKISSSSTLSQKDIPEGSRRLNADIRAFVDWSHDNLSVAVFVEDGKTNFKFIPSDHCPEEPHEGGEANVELTMSQLSRLTDQLKSITKGPMLSKPKPFMLSSPSSGGKVVAYRDRLLAVESSPGIYHLMSISQHFLHTPASLAAEPNIVNASLISNRMLHRVKERSSTEKMAIKTHCKGIVGVAHMGYHTLNTASASRAMRRIGDCLIEVAWSSTIREALSGGDVQVSEDMISTWETRTDWRAFRSQKTADLEIYLFAKSNDAGLIEPNEGLTRSKAAGQRLIENRQMALRLAKHESQRMVKRGQAGETTHTYSDSEEENEDSDPEGVD